MPALPVALGLAAGVAASLFIDRAWLAAIPILAGIGLWVSNKNLAGITIIMIGAGLLLGITRRPPELPGSLTDRQVSVTAKVIKSQSKPSHTAYIIETQYIQYNKSAKEPCRLRLTMNDYGEQQQFAIGATVRMSGKIQPFEQWIDVPGMRNLEIQHYIDGTSSEFCLYKGDIQLVREPSSWIDRLENRGSEALKQAIVKAGFDEPATVFLLATISGDDTLMSNATKEAYRSTGTAHLLALSGLHTGIVFALAAFLLFWLRWLPSGFTIYYISISLVVLAYAVVTGLSPSVARAAIMVCVYAIARIVQREPQTANSLCITIIVWLFYNPFWLLSPGFQLSVAAVAAIIWVNKLCDRIEPSRRILRTCVTTVAIPVAAMAATLAVSITYFHGFPTYFFPCNLLTTLLAGPVIACGMICSLLTAMGLQLTILPYLVSRGHSLIDTITSWFANLPHAYIEGVHPTAVQIAVYIALITCIVVALHRRRRVPGYCAAMLAGVLCFSFTITPAPHATEAFVLNNRHAPTVVLRHNDSVFVITDLSKEGRSALSYSLRHYALKCGADSVTYIDNNYSSATFARRGQLTAAGSKTILMLNSPLKNNYKHIDYVLIGHGWRGDILNLARTLPADTFVLMPDMNATRRTRYTRTLRLVHKPVKEAPFRIEM